MKEFLIAALAIFLSSASLGAQQAAQAGGAPGAAPPKSAEKIHVNVNLVNVPFTVTGRKKQLVTDLTKNDFSVYEDGKPQTIQFFSRELDLPLRIGILIDTSNSIRERLHFEQEAAIDFLNDTVRPGKDLAFVLGFDVEAQIIQDYTDDVGKLSDAIRSLQAGGGTGLYDAIYYACKQKMIYTPPPQPYLRRVIILISDGQDNESEHTREEAISMAERGEVTIYAVSTNRTGIQTRGDKTLEILASQTGGQDFTAPTPSDLAEDYHEISRELRSQYTLAYVSTNRTHDDTFRKITIRPLVKGLHVRARPGYFPPQ